MRVLRPHIFKDQWYNLVSKWAYTYFEKFFHPTINWIISLCTQNMLDKINILHTIKYLGYLYYLCLLLIIITWEHIFSIFVEFFMELFFIMVVIQNIMRGENKDLPITIKKNDFLNRFVYCILHIIIIFTIEYHRGKTYPIIISFLVHKVEAMKIWPITFIGHRNVIEIIKKRMIQCYFILLQTFTINIIHGIYDVFTTRNINIWSCNRRNSPWGFFSIGMVANKQSFSIDS